MPDRKINFCSKLPLKLFPATVADADIGSLKFFHTLFDTYLDHMLAKFKPNRNVLNVQNVDVFSLTKTGIFETIHWQSVDAILQDVSVAETIV